MNLERFAEQFSHENAEVIYLSEKCAEQNEYVDFFYSFFFLEDTLYSANGTYPLLPYYGIGNKEFHDDGVILRKYTKIAGRLEVSETFSLGPGGDPRTVSNGIDAYVFIIGNPFSDFQTLIYDVRNKRKIKLTCSDPDFKFGKNWQPYIKDERLFIVHEITPFRIMEVDLAGGTLSQVLEVDISFKINQSHAPSSFHYPYPFFRGGSNAIAEDGNIFGVGRATSERYKHHPFFWRFGENQKLLILFTEFFYKFQRYGFNIIDPTCLFLHDDGLYFGLCCSERDWAHGQEVLNLLVRFSQRPITPGNSLESYFLSKVPTESNGKPNLDRHLFFCIEMPTAVSSVHELGGRLSLGLEEGHLFHGPYITVEAESEYYAELSYLTLDSTDEIIGFFDVTSSRLDSARVQHDFHTLGMAEVQSRQGSMATSRVIFNTVGSIGKLLEFRFFVRQGVKVNAFHVRTQRIQPEDLC